MPVKQVASDVLNWLCIWNVKSVFEVHKKACKTCEMCYLASVNASCGPDIWTLAGVTAQSCQFYNLSSISPGAIVLSPSDSGVQAGDQPVRADRGELGRRLHLRQPERQPPSPAGVWEQRQAVRHARKHVYLIYHCYVHTHAHTLITVFCLAT